MTRGIGDLRSLPRDLQASIAVRLRARGQRYTPNRRSLVGILGSAGQPLTLPEILARGRGLAQSSVYRNLLVLEQAGVVRRLATGSDFAGYELAEDLTGHHHHLVCTSCGSVEDLPPTTGLERTVQRVMEDVASRRGFRAGAHRIDMLGLCKNCG